MADIGRPRKYKDDWIEKTITYIEKCIADDELPMVEWLGYKVLDTTDRTIYRYTSEKDENGKLVYPEFCLTIDVLMQVQKSMLIKKGLDSSYNSTIAKFILINNHGMSDKIRQEIDNKGASEGVKLLRKLIEDDDNKEETQEDK